MQYYATLFKHGIEKFPLIIAEIQTINTPGYETLLTPAYKLYLSESIIYIENKSIIIYNSNSQSKPEFKFAVKLEFIKELKEKNILLFELHLHEKDDDIIHSSYLFTNLYQDSYPEKIEETNKPKFHLYNKNKIPILLHDKLCLR